MCRRPEHLPHQLTAMRISAHRMRPLLRYWNYRLMHRILALFLLVNLFLCLRLRPRSGPLCPLRKLMAAAKAILYLFKNAQGEATNSEPIPTLHLHNRRSCFDLERPFASALIEGNPTKFCCLHVHCIFWCGNLNYILIFLSGTMDFCIMAFVHYLSNSFVTRERFLAE